MIAVLLTILKILGIILLVVLGVLVLLILVLLFVPIRYKLTTQRRLQEEAPNVAIVRVSWLLHIFRFTFCYPEATYFRLKILCFTVFRSDAPPKEKRKVKKKNKDKVQKQEQKMTEAPTPVQASSKQLEKQQAPEKQQTDSSQETNQKHTESKKPKHQDFTIQGFFRRLWSCIKNIQYTIRKIYDKIKHIVKNIHYYIEILKSETFCNAWTTNSRQVLLLLKSVKPRKVEGQLIVGTGDPASTAQILAAYSMLYPFWGTNIAFTPDFEQVIFEGEVLIKGRITLFRLLKTGATVYLNKDLRKLIDLLKREAE